VASPRLAPMSVDAHDTGQATLRYRLTPDNFADIAVDARFFQGPGPSQSLRSGVRTEFSPLACARVSYLRHHVAPP
jgi:hypothetical protein